MTPLLWAIAGYLLLQFGIGVAVSRRIATEADYLIAGRRLGPWVATASIFATWFGAETIVGSAALVHRDGLSLATVEPFGYGLCIIVAGLVFAVPLWRRQLTTLADLFRQRYGAGVERVAAVILIPTSILWAAAQLRAFAQVITVSGAALSFDTGLAVAAVLVIAYTMVGGMLADAITDLVQAAVVTVALVALAVVVLHDVGGVSAAAASISAQGNISLLPRGDWRWWELVEAWAVPLCGSVVAAELISRMIAARSATVARGAAVSAGLVYLLVGSIPLLLALVAGPLLGVELADAEQVIPQLARQALPGWLYVIFAGGLVSAILSTVDSTLLIAAGLGGHNLILPFFPAATDRDRVRLSRALVALGGLVAWGLARSVEGVYHLVELASSFGSAGILVTVCFALFSRVGGPRAALAALLGGLAAYVGALIVDSATPFVISLSVALLGYVITAAVEPRRSAVTPTG